MRDNKVETLDDFLKKNGFETSELSEKEKLKMLKNIIFTVKVSLDYEEQKYTNSMGKISTDEFLEAIHNLEIIKLDAQGHLYKLTKLQKENRRLKRKKFIQKILRHK